MSVNDVNISKTKLSNMNFSGDLTIVIPRLPCLLKIANAVLSTVVLVNSETADCFSSFSFAMCMSASKCYPIKLVLCSDGWRRT